MADTPAYTRPRGIEDIGPDRFERRARIEATLLKNMADRGFRQVASPMVEYLDLYGPDRLGPALYHHLILARLAASAEFPLNLPDEIAPPAHLQPGMPMVEAALRPELTTPLARMYLERLLSSPTRPADPTRWSTAGQVFRDRLSGSLRQIEFRQIGAELFGAPGDEADLEMLRLGIACTGALDFIDPARRLVYIGHAGLFGALLQITGLSGARLSAVAHDLVAASRLWLRPLLGQTVAEPAVGLHHFLVRQTADLSSTVRSWIAQHTDSPLRGEATRDLDELLSLIDQPDAVRLPWLFEAHIRRSWRTPRRLGGEVLAPLPESLITALLGLIHLGFKPGEGRLAMRNIEGAFTRLDRHWQELRRAALRPSTAAHEAEVERHMAALHHTCIRLSTEYPDLPVIVTPSASRGFGYYTGITFEIHTATGAARTSICGGGRYDQLPRLLRDRMVQTRSLRRPDFSPPSWLRPADPALSGVGLAIGLDRLEATEACR